MNTEIINKNEALEQGVAEFSKLMEDGLSKITKACKVYVSLLDNHDITPEEFAENFKGIPVSAFARFELIGRGLIIDELVNNFTPAGKRLSLMSPSVQRTCVKSKLDLLLPNGDSLKVNFNDLTPKQVKQVFSKTNIRTLGEQRLLIEDGKKNTLSKLNFPYILEGKKVVLSGKFSRQDLQKILASMN